ncbi:MAG TPA: hypothetical protein VHW44_30240 [Pseudonocardiaceae bacterium]|jgi:hypothetical protein|nr:hypothetical protein [Pseudonocardiaceae bacterium]
MTQQPPYPPDNGPYQQYPPPPVPTPAKKRKKWPWIVGGLVVLLIIIIVASSNSGSKTQTAGGAAATTGPGAAVGAAPAASTTQAPPAKPTVVYTKTGNGEGSTPNFTTGAEWQIQYTYDCSKFGQSGNFAVTAGDDINVAINELGDKGGDTSYVHADAGTHALQILSECSWTVTVLNGA